MGTYARQNQISFADGIRAALVSLMTSEYTIDVDKAWAAYEADPARFHAVTEDNPDGDPFATFMLRGGPWWIDTEHDEFCEQVHHECTECGVTYDGYDCGHVDQPTPVSPSVDNGGKPLCHGCWMKLGYTS